MSRALLATVAVTCVNVGLLIALMSVASTVQAPDDGSACYAPPSPVIMATANGSGTYDPQGTAWNPQ